MFYGGFCKVCEMHEEEKNEEIAMKFWSLVSQKCLEQFSSNLVCRLPYLASTSVANLVPITYEYGGGLVEELTIRLLHRM